MQESAYKHSVVNDIIRVRLEKLGRGAQVQLARELGVRPQTVSKWVSGENTPKPKDWSRIEAALGLDPATFHDAVYVHQPAAVTAGEGRPPTIEVERDVRMARLEAKVDQLVAAVEAMQAALRGTPTSGRSPRQSRN